MEMKKKKKLKANIRDWKYIYEFLGNECYSLIPQPFSGSTDYLFYMGKFETVIGIQQKSNQTIDCKLIAEEAEKFNPVANFLHILFIIGFGKININDLKENCIKYIQLDNGTIYIPSLSTIKFTISHNEKIDKLNYIDKQKKKCVK